MPVTPSSPHQLPSSIACPYCLPTPSCPPPPLTPTGWSSGWATRGKRAKSSSTRSQRFEAGRPCQRSLRVARQSNQTSHCSEPVDMPCKLGCRQAAGRGGRRAGSREAGVVASRRLGSARAASRSSLVLYATAQAANASAVQSQSATSTPQARSRSSVSAAPLAAPLPTPLLLGCLGAATGARKVRALAAMLAAAASLLRSSSRQPVGRLTACLQSAQPFSAAAAEPAPAHTPHPAGGSSEEELQEFRECVRTFAQDFVAPHAAEIDRLNAYPPSFEFWRRAGEWGLHGEQWRRRRGARRRKRASRATSPGSPVLNRAAVILTLVAGAALVPFPRRSSSGATPAPLRPPCPAPTHPPQASRCPPSTAA